MDFLFPNIESSMSITHEVLSIDNITSISSPHYFSISNENVPVRISMDFSFLNIESSMSITHEVLSIDNIPSISSPHNFSISNENVPVRINMDFSFPNIESSMSITHEVLSIDNITNIPITHEIIILTVRDSMVFWSLGLSILSLHHQVSWCNRKEDQEENGEDCTAWRNHGFL